MKQTAVELFIEQLEAQGESWENVSIGRIQISIKVEDYLKLIEQAKEMEKQQIIDTQSYAISLLKQTTEYEVLDSWKEKVKELEQLINKI
jgi:fructose-1-phosphate kinase PfkB-like protein